MPLQKPPKALLTDVFGTVVDWRSTVVEYLTTTASSTLNSPSASIASGVRLAAAQISWADFAQEWHSAYWQFTHSFDSTTMKFKSIDQVYLDNLVALVRKHGIDGLWTSDELKKISLIWHSLNAWPDSSPGIAILSKHLNVGTLSNGDQALLRDLASHGNLAYTHFVSAEDFQAYKPHESVYLGGCARVGQQPSDCALVAAHLSDLAAARSHGIQTIYIQRAREEAWPAEKVDEAKGWVDMWIGENDGGFLELARRLGYT